MYDLEEVLRKLKIVLELQMDNSKDDILKILIEDTAHFIKDYTHREVINEPLLRSLVTLKYNALGSEGLSSENYNGTSQSFLNDLPSDTKRQLQSVRKVNFYLWL